MGRVVRASVGVLDARPAVSGGGRRSWTNWTPIRKRAARRDDVVQDRGGPTRPLQREESIRQEAQCGVVVETRPGATLEVVQSQLLLELLVAAVGMGEVGVVLGLEVSRLARSSSDWHRLLEICALTDTLILDEDGLYNPAHFNDRLLLGLKGTMSEALCGRPHNASYANLRIMPTWGSATAAG